jgi:hypothetical protein
MSLPKEKSKEMMIESNDSSSIIEEVDIETYDEFTEPIQVLASRDSSQHERNLQKLMTGVSLASARTSDPTYEVDFAPDDPANPKNWPMWKTAVMIFCLSFSTLSVVLYSTSYTAGIPAIVDQFHLQSETIGVLGVTVYLIGLAAGSILCAPLSEIYGRKPVYVITFFLFTVFIIPCGVAQNYETILITRFFSAFFGSSLIANAPGSINDCIQEEYRALAFSAFALGAMNGPVIVRPTLSYYKKLLSILVAYFLPLCTALSRIFNQYKLEKTTFSVGQQ